MRTAMETKKQITMTCVYSDVRGCVLLRRDDWKEGDFVALPDGPLKNEIGEAVFYENAFLRNIGEGVKISITI